MAAVLSQHDSNPLEARSSDTRNNHYNKVYKAAATKCGADYHTSSDPLYASGFHRPEELREYHKHLAQVIPGLPQRISEKMGSSERLVDLDADMESDDELQDAYDQDDTPHKGTTYHDDEQMQDIDEDDLDQEAFDDEDDAQALERGLQEDEYEGDFDEEMDQDWEGVEGAVVEEDCFVLDESEEERSLQSKSPEEEAEIQQEIEEFMHALPQLERDYKLIDRLGTGTFSSVYKAIDLQYSEWDNTPWLGHHPPDSSAYFQSAPRPPGARVFAAIKRIYVTSGPERIKNELMIMEICRGCRHVSQLITAFRHEDQVAIVMPYHRNADFREYFEVLPMEGIKSYFRALLRALRDINNRGIIHRDVKPANFLFDPRTGQGSLCDFGLAQRFEKAPTMGACLHTQPTRQDPHGKYLTKNQYDPNMVKRAQAEARRKNKASADWVGVPEKDTRVPMKANRAGTRGFRAPEVLFKCGQQSGAVDVWSVGIILLFFLTRRFPLFQSNDDIEALMEIAAVLGKTKMEKVATLHCRTFSSNVPDLQQDQVTWTEFVERLNPDVRKPPKFNPNFYPYTLPSYRERLRQEGNPCQQTHQTDQVAAESTTTPDNTLPEASHSPPTLSLTMPTNPESSTKDRSPSPSATSPISTAWESEIDNALDLLEKLLQPESVKRITPRDALYHPFLQEKGKRGDDYYEPKPPGLGVCAEMHFTDPVTDQPGVIVRVKKCVCDCGACEGGEEYEEVKKLICAGEGIPIGDEPCEFHKDMVWL